MGGCLWLSEGQGLGLLPGEALITEMSVLRGPAINRVDEVELLHDDAWPHVEILLHDLNQL